MAAPGHWSSCSCSREEDRAAAFKPTAAAPAVLALCTTRQPPDVAPPQPASQRSAPPIGRDSLADPAPAPPPGGSQRTARGPPPAWGGMCVGGGVGRRNLASEASRLSYSLQVSKTLLVLPTPAHATSWLSLADAPTSPSPPPTVQRAPEPALAKLKYKEKPKNTQAAPASWEICTDFSAPRVGARAHTEKGPGSIQCR